MKKRKIQKINLDQVRPDKSLTPDELTDADLEVVVGGLDASQFSSIFGHWNNHKPFTQFPIMIMAKAGGQKPQL